MASNLEKLVDSLTGLAPNTSASQRARAIALQGTTNHNFLRPSHFEIYSTLDGLVEKLAVRSRPDLADALAERVQKVRELSKNWAPDFLALLLSLSSDPVKYGSVKHALRPQKPVLPAWEDFMADLSQNSEEEEDEHRADEGADTPSSDLGLSDIEEEAKHALAPPPDSDADILRLAQSATYTPDTTLLADLPTDQLRPLRPNDSTAFVSDPPILMPEIEVCKHVILMLRGVATPLFPNNSPLSHHFQLAHPVVLSNTSVLTPTYLLREAIELGSAVFRLRYWTKQLSKPAVVKAFQKEAISRLLVVDEKLSHFENTLAHPESGPVSLLRTVEFTKELCEPVVPLSYLVSLEQDTDLPFSYLDRLFSETCLAQLSGRLHIFSDLSSVFLKCLRVHLRSSLQWMETGELDWSDKSLFIERIESEADHLHTLWHSHYQIRKSTHSKPVAPKFIYPFLPTILSGGKATLFLRELTDGKRSFLSSGPSTELNWDLDSHTSLLFSEFVQQTLSRFFEDIAQHNHDRLTEELQKESHIRLHLNLLNSVFLARVPEAFGYFSSFVFRSLSQESGASWNSISLTQMAQDAYEHIPNISTQKLQIRVSPGIDEDNTLARLQDLALSYQLPWYISNIIPRESMQTLHRVFSLLLCVERARSMLKDTIYTFRDLELINKHRGCAQCSQLYSIRQRSIWFIGVIQTYLTADVISQLTSSLDAEIDKAPNFDALCKIHQEFISSLKRQCFLTDVFTPALEQFITLLDIAIEVSRQATFHFDYSDSPSMFKHPTLVVLQETFDSSFENFRSEIECVSAISKEANWTSLLCRF